MKLVRSPLLRALVYVALLMLGILAISEANYLLAIRQAERTDGTDAEIFDVMARHGFYDDDYMREPTAFQKVDALLWRALN